MRTVGALLAVAALASACDSVDDSHMVAEQQQAGLVELEEQILALIGTPSCSDVSQCASVAFGDKPCGGPWKYLVYSTHMTDGEALEALVAEYNAADRSFNEENGIISDCEYISAPVLACTGGICVGIK